LNNSILKKKRFESSSSFSDIPYYPVQPVPKSFKTDIHLNCTGRFRPSSVRTTFFSVVKTCQLMLVRGTVSARSDSHTELINRVWEKISSLMSRHVVHIFTTGL